MANYQVSYQGQPQNPMFVQQQHQYQVIDPLASNPPQGQVYAQAYVNSNPQQGWNIYVLFFNLLITSRLSNFSSNHSTTTHSYRYLQNSSKLRLILTFSWTSPSPTCYCATKLPTTIDHWTQTSMLVDAFLSC